MDAAIRSEWIIEADVIAHAMSIDKNHDMTPQMALLVEYVAAQPRIDRERGFQRIAQHRRRSIDLRQFGEAPQLMGKDDLGHETNYCVFDCRMAGSGLRMRSFHGWPSGSALALSGMQPVRDFIHLFRNYFLQSSQYFRQCLVCHTAHDRLFSPDFGQTRLKQ
jgi:hypothetical protein